MLSHNHRLLFVAEVLPNLRIALLVLPFLQNCSSARQKADSGIMVVLGTLFRKVSPVISILPHNTGVLKIYHETFVQLARLDEKCPHGNCKTVVAFLTVASGVE